MWCLTRVCNISTVLFQCQKNVKKYTQENVHIEPSQEHNNKHTQTVIKSYQLKPGNNLF